jgi:hypothetical protein
MVTVSLEGGVQPGMAIALPTNRIEGLLLSLRVGVVEETGWMSVECRVGLAPLVAVTWTGAE